LARRLNIIKVKKADKAEILNRYAIEKAIDDCKSLDADIYGKAVLLLKGLIQKHPFASGNRRTAFIATKDFLLSNNQKFEIQDNPGQARVMQGIRENYYTDEEVKEWIKNGKIRKFER
jgi:prophage maintenance system killer protein